MAYQFVFVSVALWWFVYKLNSAQFRDIFSVDEWFTLWI